MTPSPLVTCIIPVFNGERFIAECLESVFQQTYRRIEVVVVNDGSTDGTKAVLNQYASRIKVIDQDNAGMTIARNRGVEASLGGILAFLDADDLWLAEKTEIQIAKLAANPGVGICTCMMENFWDEEVAEEADLLRGSKYDGPRMSTIQGMIFRREMFNRMGGINPEIEHNSEVDVLSRAREKGIPVAHVDRVLVRRRIHANNASRARGERGRADLLRLAEQAISRHRRTDAK